MLPAAVPPPCARGRNCPAVFGRRPVEHGGAVDGPRFRSGRSHVDSVCRRPHSGSGSTSTRQATGSRRGADRASSPRSVRVLHAWKNRRTEAPRQPARREASCVIGDVSIGYRRGRHHTDIAHATPTRSPRRSCRVPRPGTTGARAGHGPAAALARRPGVRRAGPCERDVGTRARSCGPHAGDHQGDGSVESRSQTSRWPGPRTPSSS